MSSTISISLGAFCALSLILDVLTLAAVGRIARNHDQSVDVLIGAHNTVAERLSDVGFLVLSGINALASSTRLAASSNRERSE